MLINLDLSWTLSKLFLVISQKVEGLSFHKLKSECDVFRSVIQDFNARQDSLAELEFQKKKVENDAKGKKTVKPNVNKMTRTTTFVLRLHAWC
jgi:hypothetical protein